MTATKTKTTEEINVLLFDIAEYARQVAPNWASVRAVMSFSDSVTVDAAYRGWGDSGFYLGFKDGAAKVNGPATERSPAEALLVSDIMHGLAVLGAAMESEWKRISK